MDYIINKAAKIAKIQAVTLAGTSTVVTLSDTRPFRIYNTGNAVMFYGPTSVFCDIGAIIPVSGNDGILASVDGKIYMRGTAGQTASIVYLDQI